MAEAIEAPGGYQAVQLRVAEQYIEKLGMLAKQNNTDQRGHLNRMLRFWAQLECATAFSPSLAILEKVRAIR